MKKKLFTDKPASSFAVLPEQTKLLCELEKECRFLSSWKVDVEQSRNHCIKAHITTRETGPALRYCKPQLFVSSNC